MAEKSERGWKESRPACASTSASWNVTHTHTCTLQVGLGGGRPVEDSLRGESCPELVISSVSVSVFIAFAHLLAFLFKVSVVVTPGLCHAETESQF